MWEKNDKQRRHFDVIKKFGTLLYIFAGSMTYEFIHKNVAQALPSLRTIQTIVQSDYSKVEEGAFRFDELLQHLRYRLFYYIYFFYIDIADLHQKVLLFLQLLFLQFHSYILF